MTRYDPKNHRHKYATISGGIEPDDASPLDAAKRELREETTLDADALPLLCHGKHYSFIDRKANYEWSVHPFAFRLTPEAEAQIQLGWEHESYKWFPVDEVPEREAELAAGIVESLRRVWPEKSLGRVEELSRYVLREGSGSGGGQHNDSAAVGQPDVAFQVFVQTVSERLAEERAEWWRLVRLAAWHVWNNADGSVKGATLGRLVRGLEFLETLVVHQDEVLAPQFETLAAIALHNVDLQQGGQNGVLETERTRITEQAHRLFEDLWTIPEAGGEEDGS